MVSFFTIITRKFSTSACTPQTYDTHKYTRGSEDPAEPVGLIVLAHGSVPPESTGDCIARQTSPLYNCQWSVDICQKHGKAAARTQRIHAPCEVYVALVCTWQEK